MKSVPSAKCLLLAAILLITTATIYQEHRLFFDFRYSRSAVILFAIVLIFTVVITNIVFSRIAKEYGKSDSLSPFSSYLQVFVFLMLALLINVPFFFSDWPKIHVGLWTLSSGLVLLFLGGMVTLLPMKIFGSWKKVIGNKTNRLDTAGFYRYSRNPQLVGYGIFLLGFTFLWPSFFAIISYLVYCYISYKMVGVEETHLKKTFGREYLDYSHKTPRYL